MVGPWPQHPQFERTQLWASIASWMHLETSANIRFVFCQFSSSELHHTMVFLKASYTAKQLSDCFSSEYVGQIWILPWTEHMQFQKTLAKGPKKDCYWRYRAECKCLKLWELKPVPASAERSVIQLMAQIYGKKCRDKCSLADLTGVV